MNENYSPTTQPESSSLPAWIWWLAGCGCLLILCTSVALVAGVAIYHSNLEQMIAGPTAIVAPTEPIAPVTPAAQGTPNDLVTEGSTMGDPNAPVKIIIYVDFQCEYCQRYWKSTEPQIIETYIKTGKAFYEFRAMTFLGQESQDAAEAAYCAADQGKFWEFHDILFTNLTGENVGDFTEARLRQYAATIGLDVNAFNQCLQSDTNLNLIQADQKSASLNNITAAPSFLINGQLVEGAQPFEVFRRVIEAALSK